MEKIAEQKKVIQYIVVNSKKDTAFSDSLIIAETFIKNFKDEKVIILADNIKTENLTSVSYKGIARLKRGKIAIVKTSEIDKENIAEAFNYMIRQLKQGLLIVSDDFFAPEVLKKNVLLKKTINILLHTDKLELSENESKMLNSEKQKLADKGVLNQNWSFRIYKDPNFKENKETFEKFKAIYGIIDAAGIIFTQHYINISEDKSFGYYYFFSRKNEAFNKDRKIDFVQMLVSFGLDDNTITPLVNIFYPEDKELLEKIKKENQKDNSEKSGEKEDNILDDVLTQFSKDLFEKIEKGEMSMTSVLMNKQGLIDFVMPYYEKVQNIITIEDFMKAFQTKFVSMFM